jgi:cyclase
MRRARVIPALLVEGNGLVKTRKFKDPVYVGDPVNAVRIFSDKEVDEIAVMDIGSARTAGEPNYELLAEMAGEAFMPMAYGGGVRTLTQIRKLIRSGIEKVIINTAAVESLDVVREAVATFGSQAIVGALDVRKSLIGGVRLVTHSASQDAKPPLFEHLDRLVEAGVGELLVTSVDRDGEMVGYDLDLVRKVSARVTVPVIANGGAGTVEHLEAAVRDAGASAVAAGSMFVFHGKRRAVLISYPAPSELARLLMPR